MRNFNIFMINSYYAHVYTRRPDALYNLLSQLNTLDRNNFDFGCQIYEQISIPFNRKMINHFIANYCKNLPLYENVGNVHIICHDNIQHKSKISVFKSHIRVQTSNDLSFILNMFKDYSKSLFLCDFENKNYFWIDAVLKFSVV